jgi:hypothetical protein
VKRPGSGSVSANFTVTVTPTAGYTGTVNLSVGGATTGLSFNPPTGSASAGNWTWKFAAVVTSASKKGNHALSVSANDGATTKTASASLVVN